MDLVEAGDCFVLRADLPGLSESDVSIEVADDVLTISGERRFDQSRPKAATCASNGARGVQALADDP